MKQTHLAVLLSLLATSLFGQPVDFDLNKIKFKGLAIKTSKKEVQEKFGQGKKVETNYDCSFFSADQPLGPYYQLTYTNFSYIGSDKENFYLHYVDFDSDGKTKLSYDDKALSGLTTTEDFIKLFGDVAKRHFEDPMNNAIILIPNNRDDGARFTFKKGILVKFEYWTPC